MMPTSLPAEMGLFLLKILPNSLKPSLVCSLQLIPVSDHHFIGVLGQLLFTDLKTSKGSIVVRMVIIGLVCKLTAVPAVGVVIVFKIDNSVPG